jgi:hypothetical protein
MNSQPELFTTAGEGFRPDAGRTQPLVWVRELLLPREFKPGEEHVIRRISLKPGLNILWARPRTRGERPRLGEAGVFGHDSGKTTFCRLLRNALGEPHFGNDDLRQRIRNNFRSGWVVGEVVLDGKPWLVCRRVAVGPHLFVIRNAPVSKLFDEGLHRELFQSYLDELNRLMMEPLPVATFATSPIPSNGRTCCSGWPVTRNVGSANADMAPDLYQKMFLLVRELEIAFGTGRAHSSNTSSRRPNTRPRTSNRPLADRPHPGRLDQRLATIEGRFVRQQQQIG